MKILIKFRKSIMFLIKSMIIAALSFCFVQVWVTHYTDALYYQKGNYLVVFSFAFLLIVFSSLFGAFYIGIYRTHEIIYSFSLAVLFTNFFMYLELSLIARYLINPIHLGLNTIIQLIIVFIGSYCANTIYFKLYAARRLLAIFGDDQTGFKLIKKMSEIPDRFRIEQGVNINSKSVDEIKQMIDKFEGVLICDIDKNVEKEILSYCYAKNKRTYLLPSITDIIINNSNEIQISDTPVLMCHNKGLSTEQKILKRAMDIIISASLLIITLPITLITALCVKLYDGGPIFYTQNRVTQNGKIFNILKFRSMIVDADKDGAFKTEANDKRITKVGKIIRPLRIDELPQLINVLLGDMSMVGPRPERVQNVYEYSLQYPEFDLRHRVKAGVTGFAQIYGKYNTSPKDKLNMDLFYIETYSPLLDIKLLILTLKILFLRESTEGFESSSNDNIRKSKSIRPKK
ncbi:MAG: exopolysaccharide biosynthesis polyprenyl glycosylphosphotransferase [Acutalibacteraceae bacterium]|jgi:exopolysaccharide biosynthesis polyprenyl glycosylphosphotransferase